MCVLTEARRVSVSCRPSTHRDTLPPPHRTLQVYTCVYMYIHVYIYDANYREGGREGGREERTN